MVIHYFLDENLAHLSYAVLSKGEIVLIDPARNTVPYLDFATANNARIVAVIETHPHADFVSSHLEFQLAGATIYTSKRVGAAFEHTPFDEGNTFKAGSISLEAINTPGHSPDSICVLLYNEKGDLHAIFTGDTLFAGDVGRPDLRENAGNTTEKKEKLAALLYHTLHDKIMPLPDATLVYPAHGPGSLCGKSGGTELFSTIGKEKSGNYALQDMEEKAFVKLLLEKQPFVPKYFSYDVALNRIGAAPLEKSIYDVKILSAADEMELNTLVVDTRPKALFINGHLPGAFNIRIGKDFETWLGSIVYPDEPFYIITEDQALSWDILLRIGKIGYEKNIKGLLAQSVFSGNKEPTLDTKKFAGHTNAYTIIDVRNKDEAETKLFADSINIPLHELRERLGEVPTGKPIVVHCAGGYRSAAASSIIKSTIHETVFDLGEAIKKFY